MIKKFTNAKIKHNQKEKQSKSRIRVRELDSLLSVIDTREQFEECYQSYDVVGIYKI